MTWFVEVKSRLPRWNAYVSTPKNNQKIAPSAIEEGTVLTISLSAKRLRISPTKRPNQAPVAALPRATRG